MRELGRSQMLRRFWEVAKFLTSLNPCPAPSKLLGQIPTIPSRELPRIKLRKSETFLADSLRNKGSEMQ